MSSLWPTFALSLVPFAAAVLLLRWLVLPAADRPFFGFRRQLGRMIRRRLGGYRQRVNAVDPALPTRVAEPRRALVIGSGLAGLGSAALLAERGFDVTVIDRNDHIGGKIGAWREQHAGTPLEVEHGFHAYFRHYYNLNRFLLKTGVRAHMKRIDDYLIVDVRGRRYRFADVETSPLLNLISLAKAGLYRFRDVLFNRASHRLEAFLRYDRDTTFAALDGVSYRDFADSARIPASLRLVFNTFARAFFADADRLSMAELVKSFHFYYLSHDLGLLYDYPAGDHRQCVLEPIEAHLRRHGVRFELGRGVSRIAVEGTGYVVDGERYDYCVLAANADAARAIACASPDLRAHCPRTVRRLETLRPSQRYAVLRVWIDRDLVEDMPVFVSTERREALDAFALIHRISPTAERWAKAHAGAVLELHCYAVPDELADDQVEATLLGELLAYFPELEGMRIHHRSLSLRADFTALHVGMAKDRPTHRTELDTLVLAGDWVALPIPAMLMEAAYSAGLYAANHVLAREGLRQEPVFSVPLRGLLAPRILPVSPARALSIVAPPCSTRPSSTMSTGPWPTSP